MPQIAVYEQFRKHFSGHGQYPISSSPTGQHLIFNSDLKRFLKIITI